MSDETHVLEYLPGYAIGSLDEAEAQLVVKHVAACVLCRRELDAYQAVADQLVLTVPDAVPSADTKELLVDRIQNLEKDRSKILPPKTPSVPVRPETKMGWRRLFPVGGVIALFLILILVGSNLLLWQKIQNLEVLSDSHGMRAVALHSNEAAPRASGFVVVGADGQNGVLVVDQMPPLEAGKEYQLWLVRDGEITSAAVFSVDETGYRGVRVQAPQSLLLYSGVRVTIEPEGGSASPRGKEVLSGSLFNH